MFIKMLEDFGSVKNYNSWFRVTPHYWPKASESFAYAVASVEVVLEQSEPARNIFTQIVEGWGNPAIKTLYNGIMAEVPKEIEDQLTNAIKKPETVLFPDPSKPFVNVNEFFSGNAIEEIDSSIKGDAEEKFIDAFPGMRELMDFFSAIFEFILVGFNRDSDIEKGNYRVTADGNSHWLIWAVMLKAGLEYADITLEGIRRAYKLRNYKGKVVDFHKELAEKQTSRLHRMIVKAGKDAGLRLKNDQTIVETAHYWYQCRVVFPGIKDYCDDISKQGIMLEPENIRKRIKPCDEAVGYIRRLPRKEKPK